MRFINIGQNIAGQRQLAQIVKRNQSGADTVVNIMVINLILILFIKLFLLLNLFIFSFELFRRFFKLKFWSLFHSIEISMEHLLYSKVAQ